MNADSDIFSKPIVSFNDVSFSYRSGLPLFLNSIKFKALSNIDFSINPGDRLAIIGRNGAGKSTLLKIVAGILRPDAGNIKIATQSVSLLSLELGFDTALSGRTNAIVHGMLMGFDKQRMLALMPEIIEFSELEEFIDKPVSTYSSGMRSRLGFSISLHLKPDILLIDEVLAVGDAEFRAKCRSAMEKTFQSGTTVIMVSHNVKDVEKFCNKVIWIEHGEMVQQGETQTVLSEYDKA